MTHPFHTIEPCNSSFIEEIIEHHKNGNQLSSPLLKLLNNEITEEIHAKDQLVQIYVAGHGGIDKNIREWYNQDVQLAREEIGRLPEVNMNAIDYICNYLKPVTSNIDVGVTIVDLMEKLSNRLLLIFAESERFFNHPTGIQIHGYLKNKEIIHLIELIEKGEWSVSEEEPFEEGVVFLLRHLRTHLRSAKRNGHGLWLRSHS